MLWSGQTRPNQAKPGQWKMCFTLTRRVMPKTQLDTSCAGVPVWWRDAIQILYDGDSISARAFPAVGTNRANVIEFLLNSNKSEAENLNGSIWFTTPSWTLVWHGEASTDSVAFTLNTKSNMKWNTLKENLLIRWQRNIRAPHRQDSHSPSLPRYDTIRYES